MFQQWALSKSTEKQFFNYYKKEKDFNRIATIYAIASYVVCPIFILLAQNFPSIPSYYIYVSSSFPLFYPIYIGLSIVFKQKENIVFFFIFHLFLCITYLFNALKNDAFPLKDYLFFFAFFAAFIQNIQRFYATILFATYVSSLFIYSYLVGNKSIISIHLMLFFIGLFSLTTLIVLFFRNKLVITIQNYTDYLNQTLIKSGSGLILFRLTKENLEIVDYNKHVDNLLKIENNEQQRHDQFFELLTPAELQHVQQLQPEESFRKKVTLQQTVLEFKIVLHPVQQVNYWLCRIEDVTEQIRIQETIENSEKRYRNLYDKNQAGVFTLDESGKIINGNHAFFQLLNHSFQVGDQFTIEKVHWRYLLTAFEQKEFLQNDKVEIVLPQTNEVKTLLISWYCDKLNNHIEGTAIDITTVENTTKALQFSEEKFRLIFEESNDAIFILKQNKIIEYNHKAKELFGKETTLLDQELVNFTYNLKSDKQEIFEHFITQLSEQKTKRFNWDFFVNQNILETEIALNEIRVDDEVYVQCVLHDNTKINKYIRAVESGRKNYQAILQNIPEGFILIQQEQIVFVNSAIYQLLNIELNSEFSYQTLFTPDDQNRFNELLAQHRLDKTLQTATLLLSTKDQQELITDVTLVKVDFEEKEATLVIVKDISIQTKLAKEVLRAELAEETNKQLKKEITERNKTKKLLREQYLRSKAIFDSSSNTFLFLLDIENKIVDFNKHSNHYYYSLTGESLKTGLDFTTVFAKLFDEKQIRFFKHNLIQVKQGKSERLEISFQRYNITYWLELYVNPIYDIDGNILEISVVAHDITENKSNEKQIVSSLKEKEILLKEIHHRVKNNLQIISSILNLQSSFVTDEKTLDILQESRNRIRSMAIIHESLYQTTNFSSLNFSDYIKNITSNLFGTYRINENKVHLVLDLQQVDLLLDQAIPCGLLVNELITNALKYAFPADKTGTVTIVLKEIMDTIELSVADSGIGLPDHFDIETLESLGLQLVLSLTEQLNGNINIVNENGAKFFLTFEKAKH